MQIENYRRVTSAGEDALPNLCRNETDLSYGASLFKGLTFNGKQKSNYRMTLGLFSQIGEQEQEYETSITPSETLESNMTVSSSQTESLREND